MSGFLSVSCQLGQGTYRQQKRTTTHHGYLDFVHASRAGDAMTRHHGGREQV